MACRSVAELVEDSVPVGLLHFGVDVEARVALQHTERVQQQDNAQQRSQHELDASEPGAQVCIK